MAGSTLIHISNIRKEYVTGDVVTKILFGIDLVIAEGEFVAIMGPSGSGKSTLMHILGFLDTATNGSYLFHGQDVSQMSDTELAHMRSKNVGFVFQSFNLLPRTTVFDNVKLPLVYAKDHIPVQHADDAIAAVGLTHRRDHYSNQLSGGEKQRVAIARAIVNDPDIVFADEPTGNLDSKSGNQILSILQDLNEKGRTIIMVTHELDTAKHAKRIVRMRDGKIERDEPITNRRFAKDSELVK